jgi:hypothetical protein
MLQCYISNLFQTVAHFYRFKQASISNYYSINWIVQFFRFLFCLLYFTCFVRWRFFLPLCPFIISRQSQNNQLSPKKEKTVLLLYRRVKSSKTDVCAFPIKLSKRRQLPPKPDTFYFRWALPLAKPNATCPRMPNVRPASHSTVQLLRLLGYKTTTSQKSICTIRIAPHTRLMNFNKLLCHLDTVARSSY